MPRIPFFSCSLLLILCLFLTTPAAAENISLSFSDLNIVHVQEFDLYKVDGLNASYLGTYNASSVLSIDPAYSYQICLKPSKLSWFDDPLTAIEGGIRTAPPVLSFLAVAIMFLLPAAILLSAWRR